MHPEDFLGFLLAWKRTRGCLLAMLLIFGMTMSPIANYLQFSCRIITKTVNDDFLTKIAPKGYILLVSHRCLAIHNVQETMDGLKI